MRRRQLDVLVLFAGLSVLLAVPGFAAGELEEYVKVDMRFIEGVRALGEKGLEAVPLEFLKGVSLELTDPVTLAYLSLFPLVSGEANEGHPARLLAVMRPVALSDLVTLREGEGEATWETLQLAYATAALNAVCSTMGDPSKPEFVQLRRELWSGDATGQTVQWEMHVLLERAEMKEPLTGPVEWAAKWPAALEAERGKGDAAQHKAVAELVQQALAAVRAGPQSTEDDKGIVDVLAVRMQISHQGEGEGSRIERVRLELCWPFSAQSFAGAEQARERMKCMSQLKQIGMAFLMYVQDHEGQFPPENAWLRPVQEYMQGQQSFVCPCDKARGNLSYFYNASLDRISEGKLKSPHRTILAAEGVPGSGGPERLIARHDGQVLVLFADGHVEMMWPEQASDPKLWKP